MTDSKNILTKLHNVQIEILDEFVRICEENKLIYFLTGGTLLGAVRHKGFIPWDDDIDVAMPRNDYEKLLDIFEDNNTTNYYVLSNRLPFVNMFYYFWGYAKFCKKGTIFAENHLNDPNTYPGIFIDIFPFDNSITLFLPIQAKLNKLSQKLHYFKTTGCMPQKKIKRFICNFICHFFTPSFFKALTYKIITLFNRSNTRYITTFTGVYSYKRETHAKKNIFPLSKISFEGNDYLTPLNWDGFLTTVYGNYMELPPVEKRIIHNPKYIIFDSNDSR